MSIADWATTISGGLSIVAAIGFTLRWTIKHYLSELKPNHGSSLNDTIKLEILPMIRDVHDGLLDVKISVAKLEGRFEQHVDDN